MSKVRLSRRTTLRSAAGLTVALPWLEVMQEARAAPGDTAQRFVTVYTPGGTVLDNGEGENRWRPIGGETEFELSPILDPLAPIRDKLLVVDGLAMRSAVGEQHQAGIIAWLTGTEQGRDRGSYGNGPSVDQVIADRLSADHLLPSLQIAVRWGTGKSHGRVHPINVANFETGSGFAPIPPRLDPQEIFDTLFGDLDDPTVAAERVARKRSILDYVDHRLESLRTKVSARDMARLDEHLTKIRDLESRLGSFVAETGQCQAPPQVDTSNYDPTTGLNSANNGSIVDQSTDEAIPAVGAFMMDMLVMALACDITPVASLQWSDTEAKHTFPWLGLSEHHHYYQHDGGFRSGECEEIMIWYSEQHLHLLQAMDAVDMGGHSLLDESVVFFGSELGQPPTHAKVDMPFLLAGGGGGLRGGRFLRNERIPDDSHNNLLVAILNLFGDERQTFGDPQHCTGPLPGLV